MKNSILGSIKSMVINLLVGICFLVLSVAMITCGIWVPALIDHATSDREAASVEIALIECWVDRYPILKGDLGQRLFKGYLSRQDFLDLQEKVDILDQEKDQADNLARLQRLRDKVRQ